MKSFVRFIVTLSLLLTIVLAEEKINLEDIERDNLRAESKSRPGNVAGPDNEALYIAPSKNDKFKSKYSSYVPQHEKYDTHKVEAPRGLSQASTYPSGPQEVYYQPEVTVGNRYQAIQQKVVSEKFAKNPHKESTFYVNIPMSQFLSYYPDIGLGQTNEGIKQQEIRIPIYTPGYSREQSYSNSKVSYQIEPQYAPGSSLKYPLVTEAILPTRNHGKYIYSTSHGGYPAQYVEELIDAQEPSPVTYVQVSNSNNEKDNAHVSQTRQEHSYVPYQQSILGYRLLHGNYAPQTTNHIYQLQEPQNIQQNYQNIEVPDTDLDLPRLPAQNFKSGQSQTSHSHQQQQFVIQSNHALAHSNEPRTLLDSYIPSNLIAAQDAERYRERPIRLERGFVPSKINYLQSYKKRKAQ